MRSVSLSKIVSKYLSKSIHFLTAFVYLFTFLGPSLAIATNLVVDPLTEERVTTPLVVTPQTRVSDTNTEVTPTVEEYQRFELKVR